MTNKPYTTVWSIIQEGIRERELRNDKGVSRVLVVEKHAHLISKTIYDFYKKNCVLALNSLHRYIIDNGIINKECSMESLGQFLKKIGFTYKTLNKRKAIMEWQRIKE